jgi:hypothetical protein
VSEGHSLSGERGWGVKPGIRIEFKRAKVTHELKSADRSRLGKDPSKRRALTSWRAQTEGQVMTRTDFKRARDTHPL